MTNNAPTSSGSDLIAVERQRQIRAEGWTPEHDDKYGAGELLTAARCYIDAALVCENAVHVEQAVRRALTRHGVVPEHDPDFLAMLAHPVVHHYGGGTPNAWPWHPVQWKPSTDPERNLVKAGALIAAEIDRILRAQNGSGGGQ